MISNVHDTALIFEGGGMRASFTAGIVAALLELGLHLDYVAGVSAGATHCIHYLSRDLDRNKRTFVDLVQDPNFGGLGSFLKGNGYFHADYLYEQVPLPGSVLPFDFDAFVANPARLRIGAFDLIQAQTLYYNKASIASLIDLMKIVRSSSSIPLLMPPTPYEGRLLIDGGFEYGIPLEIARQDGFQKFFVVLTRERGYRARLSRYRSLVRLRYQKYPQAAAVIDRRHIIYNRTLDELEQLEAAGKACLITPDHMAVGTYEKDPTSLLASYEAGRSQGLREQDRWLSFLKPS